MEVYRKKNYRWKCKKTKRFRRHIPPDNKYLKKIIINDYNVNIDGKKFFDKPVKNLVRIYENIVKITTDQEDDYIEK